MRAGAGAVRRWAAGPAAVALVVLAPVAGATGAGGDDPGDAAPASRLYLMQSTGGLEYWSVDPRDPELDSGPAVTTGGPTLLAATRPESFVQLSFAPASVLTEPATYGPGAPLRFHVALEITAAGPVKVTLAHQKAGRPEVASAPATQVSPGVWEGVLAGSGTLGGGPLDVLVVRATSLSPVHRLELGTGGASWVDLPVATPAQSVPDLLRQSPRPPAPITYASQTRSVAFNDADWAATRFTGTLDAVRTFALTTTRPAASVLAWIDLPDTPALSEPLRGRAPDSRPLTDVPVLTLMIDGLQLDVGGRSAAATTVPAGALSVRVGRSAAAQATEYQLHVVTVYGERTLQFLRWRFPADPRVFTAMGGTCGSYQRLPVTAETTTFSLSVDAASANPTSADRWAPMYELPGVGESPCAEEGALDRVRITAPGPARAYRIGATPQRDVAMAAVADTMLELEARFAYTPGG